MPFTVTYAGMMNDFMTISLTLWLAYSQFLIKLYFPLLGYVNVHHFEWVESVPPTDRHARDTLDFCNYPIENYPWYYPWQYHRCIGGTLVVLLWTMTETLVLSMAYHWHTRQ